MDNLTLVNSAPLTTEVSRIMNFNAEQIQLANMIDAHAKKYPDTAAGTEQLLAHSYDYLDAVQRVIDSTTSVQLDYLCQQYPGVYRLAKLLESLAQGISTGAIDVPKDH